MKVDTVRRAAGPASAPPLHTTCPAGSATPDCVAAILRQQGPRRAQGTRGSPGARPAAGRGRQELPRHLDQPLMISGASSASRGHRVARPLGLAVGAPRRRRGSARGPEHPEQYQQESRMRRLERDRRAMSVILRGAILRPKLSFAPLLTRLLRTSLDIVYTPTPAEERQMAARRHHAYLPAACRSPPCFAAWSR